MGLVQVKITAMVITSQYGALEPGTILRTNEAFARHLVDECQAAKWIEAPKSAEDPVATKPAARRKAKQ